MAKIPTTLKVAAEAERYAAVAQLMQAYQVDNFLSLIEAQEARIDRLQEMVPPLDPNRPPPPVADDDTPVLASTNWR